MPFKAGDGEFNVTLKLSKDAEAELVKGLKNAEAKAERQASIKPKVDTREAENQILNVGARLKQMTDRLDVSLSKVGLSVRDVAVILGAGLTGNFIVLALRKLVEFAGDSIREVAALDEQISAAEVTFESAAGSVEKFGDAAIRNLGLAKSSAIEAVNTIGALFQGFELPDKDLATVSEGIVSLAKDISSLRHVPFPEVLTALRGGLTGETEGLKRFGLAFKDVELQAKAASLGFGETNDELTEGEKRFAALAIIMDKAQAAQGNYVDTADSLANQQARVNEEFRNAKAEFGRSLEPAFISLLHLASSVLQVFTKIQEFFNWLDSLTTLDDFNTSTDESSESMQKFGYDTKLSADELKRLGTGLESATEKEARFRRNFELALKVPDLEINADRSHINVEKARLALADAEDAVTESKIRSAQATDALRTAEINSAKSSIAQERAAFAESDARFNLARSTRDVAKAERELSDVKEDARDQINLTKARLDFRDAQLQVKESVLGVRDAFFALREAEFGLVDAEKTLARAQARGNQGREEERRAALALSRAKLEQAHARLGPDKADLAQQEARLDLRQAERTLKREESGVLEAERLADAEDAVTAAKNRERDAGFALRESAFAVEEAAIATRNAKRQEELAHLAVDKAVRDETAVLLDLALAHLNVQSSIVDAAKADLDLASAKATLAGHTLTAKEQLEFFRDRLTEISGQVDPNGPLISGLSALNNLLQEIGESGDDQIVRATNGSQATGLQTQLGTGRVGGGRDASGYDKAGPSFSEAERLVKESIDYWANLLHSIFSEKDIYNYPKRAMGGTFAAYQPIVVGDRGQPEVVTFDQPGKVHTKGQWSRNSTSGAPNQQIIIQEAKPTDEATARAIGRRISMEANR